MKLGDLTLQRLREEYRVAERDLGKDARLYKSGMHFTVRSWDIEGLGVLCVMDMKAMLGLMKMESVVLSVQQKDVPLFNTDWIYAMGKETQLVELYDTMLEPFSEEAQAPFAAIRDRDKDLPAYESGAHWYDPILYPCSYGRTTKKPGDRFYKASVDYLDEYLKLLRGLPACDAEKKREKVRAFAQGLLDNGGPAVNQIRKLFGEETAQRLLLSHMYGVR